MPGLSKEGNRVKKAHIGILNAIDNCTVVYGYDAETGMALIYTRGDKVRGNFAVTKGMGLFVAVTSDSVWYGEG